MRSPIAIVDVDRPDSWTRYRAGLSRYLDVLAAEDKLVAARRRVADLEAQAFALDVALVRALGGGFAEHS